jgi:hypothetical protein
VLHVKAAHIYEPELAQMASLEDAKAGTDDEAGR